MGGYLAGYGASEERRSKLIKRWAVAVAGLLVVAAIVTAIYFFFLRDRTEKGRISNFLELLRKKDFPAAYEMWGCTTAVPCRDYSFERFLEDWGPKGPHPDASAARLAKTKSCETGVIATVDFGKGEPALLWVARADETLGFAPWPVCTPKMRPEFAK